MTVKNALLIAVSENLIFSAGTTIINFESIMPKFIDTYYVYCDSISDNDLRIISNLANVKVKKYKIPDEYFSSVNKLVLNQFTKLVFAKLEAFRILKNYTNVIVTDTDIVLHRPIHELIVENSSGVKCLYSREQNRSQFFTLPPLYFKEKNKSISAGLMVLNKLSYNELIYYDCLSFIKEYGGYLKYPEQAILEMIFEKYKIEPLELPFPYYCKLPSNESSDDLYAIEHSAGQPKFWSGINNSSWKKYYLLWLQYGGGAYSKVPLLKNLLLPIGSFRRKLAQRAYHFLLNFG